METSLRKDRFLSVKNFALYYGYGRVKELSLFDLAIVDPNGLQPAEFEKLRLNNTVVITYLSIFEVHPTDRVYQELSFDDFILIEGKPVRNGAFGTYLVSLRSKKWINHLLKQINRHFQVIESDGLFLDTIGDLEFPVLPEQIKEQQLHALVNFLSIVKMVYPNHLFVQNNGLEMVIQKTASLIDGVCWENPPVTLESSQEWVQVMSNKLAYLKDHYLIKILLLLEETLENVRNAYDETNRIAKKYDFLLYKASKNYVEGVNMIKG